MVPCSLSRFKVSKRRLEGTYKFSSDQFPRFLNPQDLIQCLAHSTCSGNSHTTNEEIHQRLRGISPLGLHPTYSKLANLVIWDGNTIITFPETLLEALRDGASGWAPWGQDRGHSYPSVLTFPW